MPLNDASAPDILPIGVRAPERITVSVMRENVSPQATGAEGQADGGGFGRAADLRAEADGNLVVSECASVVGGEEQAYGGDVDAVRGLPVNVVVRRKGI